MRYLPLWGMLALSFAIFALISFIEHPSVMGHEFKTIGFAEEIFGEQTVDAVTEKYEDTSQDVIPQVWMPVPTDTASQTILFIGDSMLEGLGPRMAAYADHNGHTLYEVMWYSSTSDKWGKSAKLKDYISRLKPTYIFICLGANELFVPDIVRKRGDQVRNIIATIGDIPYLWIGPPNWKADTGINDLIETSAAEGSFFRSDGMQFDRTKDGAHPTRSSAAAWMDSVARWMPGHSGHPIRMELPEAASGRAKRIFVHQPNEQ